MYVAMTRAEKYLFVSAEKGRESRFFEDLELEEENISGEPEKQDKTGERRDELKVERPESTRKRLVSTAERTDLDEAFTDNTDYGRKIHEFMKDYVKNQRRPESQVERKISEKIDSLSGEIRAEVEFTYPKDEVVHTGRTDLVVETEDKVRVIDLKTSENFREAHKKQLKIYREAFESITGKKVETEIFHV